MVKKIDKTPVGAHYGLTDWLAQRVTAVIMALFTLVVLGGLVLCGGPADYASWKELFHSQLFRIVSLLFLISVFYHAWIGIRDVLMDYVKPTGIRLTLEVLVIVYLAAMAIWSVSILWGN